MVKSITILSQPLRPVAARQIIAGQLRCLGGANARAKSGQDRYTRQPGREWSLEAVISGSGFVEGPNGIDELHAGDLYVMGPHGHFHYYPNDEDPWEKLFIEVGGPLMDSLARCYELNKHYVFIQVHAQQHLEHCLQILAQGSEHMQDEFPIALHQLINSIYFNNNSQSESMSDYIEAHVHEEFSLQDMAAHFSVSKNQLLRRFKKQYHSSPYEFLLQRRVEQAIWTLQHTSITVKELAESLQFSDSKHLSSTLKRRTGKSPSEHRSSF